MKIADLNPNDQRAHRQAAGLLVAAFALHWPTAWPDIDSALSEVAGSLAEGHINRVAVAEDGRILGWIGAIPEYNGFAWELHPLAVHPDHQRRGIGTALVTDLEAQVAARGGVTLFLGTDDEDSMTSLAGTDLYPDPLVHLARIQNRKNHPYNFYQKLGFALVGVIPDANGPGKPDILMAKRIRR